MENSRTCGICNVNVHRASYAKHLRSEKHLENLIEDEKIFTKMVIYRRTSNQLKTKLKKYKTRKH